jgi:hypothetical protein
LTTFIEMENGRIQQYYSACFDTILAQSGVLAGAVFGVLVFGTDGDIAPGLDAKPWIETSLSVLLVAVILASYGKIMLSAQAPNWWAYRDDCNILAWAVTFLAVCGLVCLCRAIEHRTGRRYFFAGPIGVVLGIAVVLVYTRHGRGSHHIDPLSVLKRRALIEAQSEPGEFGDGVIEAAAKCIKVSIVPN